jgi:dTDP-4-dehydrorhamnose reductase
MNKKEHSMQKRLLILGVTGMLGHTLFREYSKLPECYRVYGTARNGNELQRYFTSESLKSVLMDIDINSFDSIVAALNEVRPDVVMNCVGMIKQRSAVENPLVAIPVNALFPHRLAAICKLIGARMIHLSTDCVFSGRRGNYCEDDLPDPVDMYGRSKLLGEVDAPHCLTVRTSIIGRELHSQLGLLEWFLSQHGQCVKGYTRAIYTGFTTLVMADILRRIIDDFPELHGIWHISSEPISKYALLNLVNQIFQAGITVEPDDSVVCDRSLDSARFRKAASYTPPTWSEMMTQMKHDNTFEPHQKDVNSYVDR